jgi:porin
LTWRLPLTRRLTMQPDIQYVTNPGLDPSRGDAWAFGLRLDWAEAW